MRKKLITAIVALSLVLCCLVGGTLAWIVDDTEPVINTFTYGDINIKLEETDSEQDTDNNDNTNSYKMIPGSTITKDPKVTVMAGSEACWLFVKIEKSLNYGTYLKEYEVADGWTKLEDGVYYREVTANATKNQEFTVLANNQVTVLESVTKQLMEAIKTNGQPTLTFTAYAVQKDNVEKAADAWAIINPTT